MVSGEVREADVIAAVILGLDWRWPAGAGSVWSFVGSSLSVGIPSTQLPFSYPAALSQWIRSTLLALKPVCMLMTC